jgi:hypothetical protein
MKRLKVAATVLLVIISITGIASVFIGLAQAASPSGSSASASALASAPIKIQVQQTDLPPTVNATAEQIFLTQMNQMGDAHSPPTTVSGGTPAGPNGIQSNATNFR